MLEMLGRQVRGTLDQWALSSHHGSSSALELLVIRRSIPLACISSEIHKCSHSTRGGNSRFVPSSQCFPVVFKGDNTSSARGDLWLGLRR